MKQKILSKENQDEITRLDELRELLKARAGEKKSTISCLKEDITFFVEQKDKAMVEILTTLSTVRFEFYQADAHFYRLEEVGWSAVSALKLLTSAPNSTRI